MAKQLVDKMLAQDKANRRARTRAKAVNAGEAPSNKTPIMPAYERTKADSGMTRVAPTKTPTGRGSRPAKSSGSSPKSSGSSPKQKAAPDTYNADYDGGSLAKGKAPKRGVLNRLGNYLRSRSEATEKTRKDLEIT